MEQTIREWYEEEWDGTLECHMMWCIKGRELYRTFSDSSGSKIDETDGDVA